MNPILICKRNQQSQCQKAPINTRAIQIQGGLSEQPEILPRQFTKAKGRFVDYVNDYAKSIGANGDPNVAIILELELPKISKTDAFDMPLLKLI